MRSILSTILLTLAASLLTSQSIVAEEPKITTYGDWGYKCDKSPDGKDEQCYMFQNVTKKGGEQLVLGARIAYREEQPNPLIVVTVPLGSLLPPGAVLMMKGVEPIKLTYFLCAAEGCTTMATPLTKEMIKAMKKGQNAVVRVAAPDKQVVGLPLSLNGFTKAMGSIKK